jgi:hypothetical protein
MNTRRCLRIAERILLPFEEQTGLAIDPQRMVADRGYAMDVLTVCEANPGSVLAALARQYQLAASESGGPDTAAGADSTTGEADSTGFDSSRTQTTSVFEQERQAVRAARKSASWMTPGRWLGHDT